ncbi:hypothetical protein MSC49_14240 [Methylosinus sp. C49]|nr:hypothetical protein MSC49_14240 [Methylosinus sp. C49]
MLQQRLRDRAGARSELDDRPLAGEIDIARHGAGEHRPRGRDGPDAAWIFHPRPQKARIIGESGFQWLDIQ